MPKLKYNDGTGFKQIVPTKEEFDRHTAEKVSQVGGVHGLKVEEGVWTPTLFGLTTAGSFTYARQSGTYERIGNVVHLSFEINISATITSPSGSLRIGGIPFNPRISSNAYERSLGLIANISSIDADRIAIQYAGGQTSLQVYKNNQAINFSGTTNSITIYGTISYFI